MSSYTSLVISWVRPSLKTFVITSIVERRVAGEVVDMGGGYSLLSLLMLWIVPRYLKDSLGSAKSIVYKDGAKTLIQLRTTLEPLHCGFTFHRNCGMKLFRVKSFLLVGTVVKLDANSEEVSKGRFARVCMDT